MTETTSWCKQHNWRWVRKTKRVCDICGQTEKISKLERDRDLVIPIDVKKVGEKIGSEIYDRIAKDYPDLNYQEFVKLTDHLYAGIYTRVYKETYNKKRGNEYWKGDK